MDRQTNYIGLLHGFLQRKGWTVQYEVENAEPDHMRQFIAWAVINTKHYPGVGCKKKEAKRNAAANALKALKNYELVTNTETSVSSSVSLPSVPQANFACWLNEYAHKKRLHFKTFETMRRRSETNQLCVYACKYVCDEQEFPEATGNNKKEAKEAAAKLVHEILMKTEQEQVLDQNHNAEENPKIKNLSDSPDDSSSQKSSTNQSDSESIIFANTSSVLDQNHNAEENPKIKNLSDSPDDSSSQKSSTNQSDSESIIFANTSSAQAQQPLNVKPKRQLAPNFQNSPGNNKKQSNFDVLKMATPSTKCTPVSNQETKSRFLDEFDSIARVGRGGFGHVFKARRKLEDIIVAVKIVKFKEKAHREVKALSRLVHRNIVRYYTSWTEETEYKDETSESYSSTFSGGRSQFLYIQMEFCEGENLREWIKERNYNPEKKYPDRRRESEEIIKQILEAVKYVHLQKLIHRDLKPENIMFGPEGCVKVGDFGLVTKDDDENDEGQLERSEVGTDFYMSPEQRQHQGYDRKVDIYPVGLIFFELLWRFGTETERRMQWVNIRSRIFPEGFSIMFDFERKVIKRMLRKKAKRRPEASDLLTELMKRSSNAASKEHNVQRKNKTY